MTQTDLTTFTISPAEREDVPVIFEFVRELAEYERLAGRVTATREQLEQTLFGPRPFAEVVIARVGEKPAGFALFFHNYSTFLARPGVYLEDLFVRPEFRGLGIGRALLQYLAKIAVERGCGRLEWAVLDWNEPAQNFYRRQGAVPLDDWIIYRVTDEALTTLAQ